MTSKREHFFSCYQKLPYFTKESLRSSAERLGLPISTFNAYIHRALKEGLIIRLKRNHYVTRSFYEDHRTDMDYVFFLANILLEPSYVSMEAALQYYGLFTEAVNFSVVSVTTKLPRRFKNRLAIYSYRSIKEDLFTDFKIVKGNFDFAVAMPHKAVFDYLYYHTKGFTRNMHEHLPEDLRIDTGELSKEEKEKLIGLIKKFTAIKINL